ncbi:unnamed protein product [Toxocara canis]|uniref:BRCA1-associated protein n=1 Tax=Toxocara canis TaxID=6265 RepID=A0A183UMI0_TOXCA|nr:unnamed protein product [Toxocara canis]
MSEVTPIVIRLEVEKNAPFIKLEFSGDKEELLTRPSGSKAMSSKRRNKKAAPISRADDCGEALPPVAANATQNDTERPTPSQAQCIGRRKYAEVVVETFTEETIAKSTIRETDSEPPQGCSMQPTASDVEKMSYFSGNPFVEKTTGILHFYKHNETGLAQSANCSMLCMLGVPSLITCRELLKFVSPSLQSISAMKIIRDMTPNQYMVILKFKSHEAAVSFYDECNDIRFNQIEPERCSLVFVERVESTREEAGGSLPVDALTELPTCAVCLERMDDGVLTILCNHTFHAKCLEQWADTTCPVCRHGQTPEITPDQKCSDCGKTTDLWICLICGNIGCGRYAEAHAYRHFEATSHTFTLQIGGERVWDYAGDNYVHRLIQNASDGKMVEFQRDGANQTDVNGDEKMEAIQLEYTCLLTNQLEKQRTYFENKLADAERRFGNFEKMAQAQMEDLERQVNQAVAECERLKKELSTSEHQRQGLEKKHLSVQHKLNKALGELSEERAINKLLRDDQNKWTEKVNNLEMKNDALHEKFTATVNELNEQVRDLMLHFEAQNKFNETAEQEGFTQKVFICMFVA